MTVRTAAALRLALLRGSLRSGPSALARRVGLVVGAVLGTGLALTAFAGLAASRGHGALPADLAVLVYTALLLGWVVLPVLTFGSDDLLDPARLALLPLTRRQLLLVMGVGALIGVAPVATVVAALGLVPATGSTPASYVVAVVAAVLLLALCVGASRASAAALSGVLRSRRGRDLGVGLTAVVALSVQLINPALQLVAARSDGATGAVHDVARFLRWTPTALLATAPGRPLGQGLASLAAVAAVIALVLLGWERLVRRSLERVDDSARRRRRSTALVPRRLPLPTGRVGALAAKDLRYLGREPRRLVALLTSWLLPVLVVVLGPVALTGSRPSPGAVFAVCGVGLLTGLAGINRFGLDGTATWMLLSSATDEDDARRDLVGGDLANAVVTAPFAVVLVLALAALTGGWVEVPAALGLAGALFAVGVGLSALVAVRAPYAVPASQNLFSSGNAGQGCAASALTFVALAVEVMICLPLLGLLVPALVWHSAAWGLALLVVGPVYGLVVGGRLRRSAARQWAARGPEVMQVLASARG